MAVELKPIRYIDYKIYNVTKIKNKYGFRILLTLDDNTERTVQHSGFDKKDIAEKERCGNTRIISYDGTIISNIEKEEGIIIQDLDIEKLRKFRKEFPILKQVEKF